MNHEKISCSSFCPMLWNSMAINRNGKIRPCCRFSDYNTDENNVNISDLVQSYNIPYFQNLRQRNLKGEKLVECENCYREERAGIKSLRQFKLESYSEKSDFSELTSQYDVEYIEIFLGRECNLACHTCKPHLSTTWDKASEELNIDFDTKTVSNFNTEGLDLKLFKNLKEIKFVGGEPFINKRHFDILETIPSEVRNYITVEYFTNGTFELEKSLNEIWNEFKEVKIKFSIDGFGKVNDYIRYPSEWNKIEKNIKKALAIETSNIVYSIHCTVHLLNIFSYKDIQCWWDDLRKNHMLKTKSVNYNLLRDPKHLSIALLKKKPSQLLKLNLPENWLAFIEKEEVLEEHYLYLETFINELDRVRHHSFLDVITELNQFIDE